MLDQLKSTGEIRPQQIARDFDRNNLLLPIMSKWEFLTIMRSYQRLAEIPVLVTSGSHNAAETLAHTRWSAA